MRDAAPLVPTVMALLIVAPAAAREVPFAAEATIDATVPTVDLWHADVDGDGDMDGVAVADNEVVWYDNTAGDGSAWTTRSIAPDNPTETRKHVFPADVDGDGDTDVVAIWDRTTPVTGMGLGWHENTAGDGSTWTRNSIVYGSSNQFDRIFAADMDRDGDIDVVTGGNLSEKLSWYGNVLGDGTTWGLQSQRGCGIDTLALSVSDIDGDTDPDVLALCEQSDGTVDVVWDENTTGTGLTWGRHIVDTSTFSPTINSGNQSLLAVDVDGDGDLDLASTYWPPVGPEKVYLNLSGDFTSRSISYLPVAGAYGLSTYSAGDIDQDGDVDLLTGGRTPAPPTPIEALYWWESTGADPTTWTGHPIEGSFLPSASFAAHTTDLDGDGDLDVLAKLFSQKTAWHENLTIHRSAYFPEQEVIDSSAADPIGLEVADVDGDADLDVIAASQVGNAILWYENDGAEPPSFTTRTVASASNARWLATADIDRDGHLDVVGGTSLPPFSERLYWYENDGASPPSWSSHIISLTGSNRPVAAGDLDGDGDPDVVSGGSWYESDGASPPAWSLHSYGPSNVQSVATSDVDGDGDLDIIATSGLDRVAWYENDGASSPSFAMRSIDASATTPLAALPADVDADGDCDVVAGAFDDDEITWYESDGASPPAWTAHTITSAADGVVSAYPADLDGDGDVDVVGGMLNSGILWYENHGAGSPFWSPHTILPPAGTNFRVVTGDLDHDGDADVVSTDAAGNTVAWYPNRGGQFRLATSDTSPATLFEGTRDDVLRIDITHNGRSGDSDLEVASIELLFEDSGGTPLTTAEASALLAKVGAWAEFGTSGYWDPATDLLVTELTSFTLTDGRLTIVLADGDPLVQLPTGQMARGYIVLDATAGGSSQTPNQFRVTHVTESSTSAEDAPHDIPLTLEFAPDVTTQLITVPEPAELILLAAGVAFLVTVGRRRTAR